MDRRVLYAGLVLLSAGLLVGLWGPQHDAPARINAAVAELRAEDARAERRARRRTATRVGDQDRRAPPLSKGGPMPYPVRLARKLGDHHITHKFTRQDYTFDSNAVQSRRRAEASSDALTLENTVPLKLKVNLDALDPSKALPYTTCFNVGLVLHGARETGPPSDAFLRASSQTP